MGRSLRFLSVRLTRLTVGCTSWISASKVCVRDAAIRADSWAWRLGDIWQKIEGKKLQDFGGKCHDIIGIFQEYILKQSETAYQCC